MIIVARIGPAGARTARGTTTDPGACLVSRPAFRCCSPAAVISRLHLVVIAGPAWGPDEPGGVVSIPDPPLCEMPVSARRGRPTGRAVPGRYPEQHLLTARHEVFLPYSRPAAAVKSACGVGEPLRTRRAASRQPASDLLLPDRPPVTPGVAFGATTLTGPTCRAPAEPRAPSWRPCKQSLERRPPGRQPQVGLECCTSGQQRRLLERSAHELKPHW